MLESEFWTELSEDDEGIGSDESLERVSNSSNEGELKKKKKEPDISSNKPKDPERSGILVYYKKYLKEFFTCEK